MNDPIYNIKVKLVGTDGNAWSVIAKVTSAMRKHKVPQQEVQAFIKECTSGDYDNLLRTCMKYVKVS